jgi:hypothetical protein
MGQRRTGCRGFVGERYDVREFFSVVLRENVILGIQVLFSTPNNHPRHLTVHGRGKTPNTVTPMPYLSIDVPYPTPPPVCHLIRFSLYPGRVPPAACYLHKWKADIGLSLGETLLALASNLPGLLVLRAYTYHRARENVQDFNPVAGLVTYIGPPLCSLSPNPAGLQVHVIFYQSVVRFHGK